MLKEKVLINLEEHDIDVNVTSVSEDSLSNAWRIKEQVNMHNFRHFLGDKFHEEILINP